MINFGVEWGYEFHSIDISCDDWADISSGLKKVLFSEGDYEGDNFSIEWIFNGPGKDTLVVNYGEDGGQGFIGNIEDAIIISD